MSTIGPMELRISRNISRGQTFTLTAYEGVRLTRRLRSSLSGQPSRRLAIRHGGPDDPVQPGQRWGDWNPTRPTSVPHQHLKPRREGRPVPRVATSEPQQPADLTSHGMPPPMCIRQPQHGSLNPLHRGAARPSLR